MSLTIRTNNVPRDIVYGCELTRAEAEEFDYLNGWNPEAVDYDEDNDEFSGHSFVRYKGLVYDLSEFMCVSDGMFGDEQQWDGYCAHGFFSGVLIRLVDDNERVVCATYIG